MPKLKITQPGFTNFTGYMGDTEFKDGVSIESVSQSEARRLACFLRVEDVKTGKNPSHTQEMVDQRSMTISEMNKVKRKKGKQDAETSKGKAEGKGKGKAEGKSASNDEPTAVVAPQLDFDFTRESLGEIADTEGLDGLRKFANAYDVRGPSIRSIIESLIARKQEAEKQAEKAAAKG